MADKEQQEEELSILKSILGEDIVELGSEKDQFEVQIQLQLPSKFSLRLHDRSNQLTTSIDYLPPLVLTVQYHDQYPSSIDAPNFVLSSGYFTQRYLREMCVVLDKIWQENLAQPIVYLWIECLKEQLLSTEELILTDIEENEEDEDPRAMSNYDSSQAAHVYEELIAYNRDKIHQRFLNEYHQCSICMSNDIYGRDMILFSKCQHAFCRDCLREYSHMQINNGSVEWLLCPDAQCQLTLLPAEIQTMVNNDQLYEKYERLLLQKTLEHMLDVVWCPRCQSAVLTGNDDDYLALCDQCRFAFCKKCKKTYHSQTLCSDEIDLLELRRKQRDLRRNLQMLNLSTVDQQKVVEEFLAVARIETSTRLCPNFKCRVPIEKNMGCDHMYCTRCQLRFNWSDVKDQAGPSRALVDTYGNDFDQGLENVFHDDVNPENLDKTVVAKLSTISRLIAKRTKVCPNEKCGKVNIKSGMGNYVICDRCKRGFCFCCGQSVGNPSQHFGHACKRYSS